MSLDKTIEKLLRGESDANVRFEKHEWKQLRDDHLVE